MVYIFLQGWRATLIPLLAVPVSLVGTFVVFPALGFSINTLSLFGLVLAIGLVVDDAIVVVEAVEHHIEHGLSPRDASVKAMEEVSGPVIAIALILAAVFVPTAFIPGITGRLISAVRYHNRHLGIVLGLQCAVIEPGALGSHVASQERRPRAGRQIFPLVQSRVWQGDGRIRERLRVVDSQSWLKHAFPCRPDSAGLVVRLPPA